MVSTPEARLSCLGGPLMQSAGVPVVADNRSLSVVGASEVLSHIREFYGSWRKIRSHLLSRRPDLVILIDFPDFNLFLGRFAKKAGAKVLYYISPQIWAWRVGRVKTIKRIVDRMVVILPFEKAFYATHGMDVDYVGHPLIDILRPPPSGPDHTGLPEFQRPACRIAARKPKERGQAHVRRSYGFGPDNAQDYAGDQIHHSGRFIPQRAGDRGADSRVECSCPGGRKRYIWCDKGLRPSFDRLGTVTLEAAILETPMVITNRVSRLSAEIGKRLIHAKFIGLPNLIAGREIVTRICPGWRQIAIFGRKGDGTA